MVGQVVDFADEKSEIEGQGQDDEESEDDFFEIHGRTPALDSAHSLAGKPTRRQRALVGGRLNSGSEDLLGRVKKVL
jgi:hypothetical protein